MPDEMMPLALQGSMAFVGRERELQVLSEQLEAALAGAGSFVLIAGEPGIGKTRLVDALVERAGSRGVEAVWGHCYEDEGAPAFWPWLEALRSVIRRLPGLELRELLG